MTKKWMSSGESIIYKSKFASGGEPIGIKGGRGILNIYLTNKRIYAEIMLIHKCIANIPFSLITHFGVEKIWDYKYPVIKYIENNEEKLFYFYVDDNQKWIDKIIALIKNVKPNAIIDNVKLNAVDIEKYNKSLLKFKVYGGIFGAVVAIIVSILILMLFSNTNEVYYHSDLGLYIGIVFAVIGVIVGLFVIFTLFRSRKG